ncbi:MAG: undecaprenyldiphospho-muramoylpentapeptide beta-N-acetylglucosaminyltransferase [Acetobacterales bacterium]
MVAMPQRKLAVLAAGGTGGHLFPAQALAEELLARNMRVVLVTDRRGSKYPGALGEIDRYEIRGRGLAGSGWVGALRGVAELSVGLIQARDLIKRLSPDVVVGFGGYPSAPPLLAAAHFGVPTLLHEQNAVLGRANRFLSRRATAIATSFPRTSGIAEDLRDRVTVTGNPVRPAILSLADLPRPLPSAEGPLRILVLGGSQGASVFSNILPATMEKLPEYRRRGLYVSQQCRPEDLERVRAVYRRLGVAADLATFFDDMPARLAGNHMIISRAGASTVAEIRAVGIPAILVPYPYATDDHQTANARALEEGGGAWLLPEPAFTPEAVASRLESLMMLPQTLARAAEAARRNARTDATQRLAEQVMRLAGADGAPQGGMQSLSPAVRESVL